MPSPANRTPPDAQMLARLAARLEALEDRVRRLERQLQVAGTRRAVASPAAAKSKGAPAGRSRPRCPGCTLELPPGRRGAQCVWCGFHFAAARPSRPVRRPRAKRR